MSGEAASSAVSQELWAALRETGAMSGLDTMGVTPVRSWTATRRDLETRRSAGWSSTMQFTYRRPARSTEPARILRGARSIVVAAVGYGDGAMPDPRDQTEEIPRARVARYAARDHYRELREALGSLVGVLRAAGHRGVVVADDNALVDREAAWRAGLGWYGKNSMILVPGHGSWFVLGAVVTDAELPAGVPPVPDGCGSCDRCLVGCPTGAIVAPGVVDARRCLSWLLQTPGVFPHRYRRALGDRVYGCDDCQEVCPPSRVELRRRGAAPSETAASGRIDIVEALQRSDDDLMSRFAHWYVPERDGSVIRRNLLVAAGNVGRPEHAALVAEVDRQLDHPGEAVVDAARWARREIEQRGAAGLRRTRPPATAP